MSNHCPHCGCELARPRSGPDHRRFFGAVAKAFDQWPENAEFQPRDAEHLRAYLLVRAGHFNVGKIETPEGYADNPSIRTLFRMAVEGTAKALAGETGHYDVRVSASGVEVLTPRSIDYRTVSQREFGPIRDAVEAIIEAEIGVRVDQLLKERAA